MGSSFQCIILNIGDELLLGETLNTHAQHLSKACADLGITLRAHISVGDDIGAIHRALEVGGKGGVFAHSHRRCRTYER